MKKTPMEYKYDYPEEDIDWQEELDADPGFQDWLTKKQESDLAHLIEDYKDD